ncbi:hypothetical protein ACWIUD_02055 [Helicobacter sp. 23-1044]
MGDSEESKKIRHCEILRIATKTQNPSKINADSAICGAFSTLDSAKFLFSCARFCEFHFVTT